MGFDGLSWDNMGVNGITSKTQIMNKVLTKPHHVVDAPGHGPTCARAVEHQWELWQHFVLVMFFCGTRKLLPVTGPGLTN
jgi:hypothetical protein